MKAVRFHSFGGPEVLQYEEIENPIPGASEVLIKVDSAGVNFADCMSRRNAYPNPSQPPICPGFEVAGTVIEAGKDAKVKIGARVLAMASSGGGYRELATADSASTFAIPDDVTFEEAAALPGQALTAYFIFKDAPIVHGETVLVTAAAGGVGSVTAQIGKMFGGKKFIGTTSSDTKMAKVKEYGYDHAINTSNEDWHKEVLKITEGKGVALVLESVGGKVFYESMKSLSKGGKFVVFGGASGERVTVDPRNLVMANQRIIGFSLWKYIGNIPVLKEALDVLFQALRDKKLKLQISTYPLSDAARVHELMEASKTSGKLILKP